MKHRQVLRFTVLILSLSLMACNSDDDDDNTLPGPPDDNGETIDLTFDFSDGMDGWTAAFADYPAGEESFYELDSGVEALPAPLDNTNGFFLNGSNRSDDLFMYLRKQFSGFEPQTRYDLDFEIVIATNAERNCIGIGGAPGEAVYIKGGATVVEPVAMNDGSGQLMMNIDKGNQATGGSDAIVIGDLANSRECGTDESTYELKTLNNDESPFMVTTDESGTLWILIGSDSGFEGITRFYVLSGTVTGTAME